MRVCLVHKRLPLTLSSLFVLMGCNGSLDVNALGCSSAPGPGAAASIEAEAVEAIAIRGADVHAALHATSIAKPCLGAEVGRLTKAISTALPAGGFASPFVGDWS